ncbi:ribosome assembly factor SBDS [Candidatus Woesearchaeota archaeon CG10_big_fil_rev_8_21_14_0_10_37_12]|nr:MAG: ribosome assembly factor SBDS [Candidatus Woesearchaeota archaeon CG10_big_fil_rev_8_21_14_0_10_37_12]
MSEHVQNKKNKSEHINVARIKKGNEHFEIVIHPDMAIKCKSGNASVSDALVYPKVYSDAKKGLLASEEKMSELFGTDDYLEVAKQIIQKGEIQITAEFRKQQVEQKKRRIIDLLHRQGVDPRTKLPHPIGRIESALDEAHAKIDPQKTAEEQIPVLLKALRPILPIKLVTKEIDITIPAEYASKSFSVVKNFAKILREKWGSNGAWYGTIEIPGGLESELYDKLNKITHGNVQATVLKVKGEDE